MKKITIEKIMSRGKHPYALEGCSAEIIRGHSIRIHGSYHGRSFDRTFNIGDMAEYDSYNLHYYGPIVSIGSKTVTIIDRNDVMRPDCRKHQLSLYQFTFRNHDFDHEVMGRKNSEMMYYI